MVLNKCYILQDGGKCTVLDNESLQLTILMGVQLPGNENINDTYITELGDIVKINLNRIAFNITVDGIMFTDNNDNMIRVKQNCKYGHIMMDGETPCGKSYCLTRTQLLQCF